jgi:hypothetical protein
VKEAASLRAGNHTCFSPFETNKRGERTFMAGGSNIHVPLVFSDGEQWMVRIRKEGCGLAEGVALRVNMASEIATLQTLHKAGVAVPDAWASQDGMSREFKLNMVESSRLTQSRHVPLLLPDSLEGRFEG